MPSLAHALEDIDRGCIYGHYSIPWAVIAANHENLETASDDSKQPEDSKPVSNKTLSEDSKLVDVPTNDTKLLEEGKPVDAPTVGSTLPIHKEDEKRVDVPPVAEDGQTDHSTQPNCQEDGKQEAVPTDDNDEEKEEDSIPLFCQLLGHPLVCYQVYRLRL